LRAWSFARHVVFAAAFAEKIVIVTAAPDFVSCA
jgi:hypothetical protein